ncbi:MAG: hypothetical protein HKN82_14805 [Akkermansiaceae bacterium]|nr:hypothetical protein [Akkermansiaceae bacterium]
MKKLAIALSIFPGILFVIALLSYVICFIAERNMPPGGVDIGLSLLLLAALINIPTIVAWVVFLVRKRGEDTNTKQGGGTRRDKKQVFVTAYLATALVIGALSGTAISVLARTRDTPDVNRVDSIGDWEQRTQLPGFTLLDRADLPGYYLCVYDTGLGEIAFCYNQKQPENAKSHSFAVYDTRGQNLQDPARWNKRSDLNSHGKRHFIAGMVVPVRPDYSGTIQIEFSADSGSGFEPVYAKRLPYNGNSEQDGADQPATAPESEPGGDEEPQTESEGRSQ